MPVNPAFFFSSILFYSVLGLLYQRSSVNASVRVGGAHVDAVVLEMQGFQF